eukprot:CAMPEP_0174856498 /NCGR_PEP_ID=MMETSP1114-20130205/36057_1 /TAXON_ID=312471 /ORGANISM="Neobodo designis, Strain CCAP 1951/1" /LENGTH=682 /DNA_ID=CAMNT_0016091297 /DNA_START=57 /DNA_END=2105 /DNA_ORIENTATION=+
MTASPTAPTAPPDDPELEHWECLLCSEPIVCFGVFNCGHFTCDTCALRMRTFPGANANIHHGSSSRPQPHYRGASKQPIPSLCPVCRGNVDELVITSEVPPDDDAYPRDTVKKISDRAHPAGSAHARLDGDVAASRIGLLTRYFCPVDSCWEVDPETGAVSQEPFVSFDLLKEHLAVDHKMKYCRECLDNRPAFLSEQRIYTDSELAQHNRGRCSKDPQSFVGHPLCLFCNQRHYEGDALLKHMQQKHVTCDICNAGEFIFVYYQNHAMLDRHFLTSHSVCTHRDCESQPMMMRVFRDEMALNSHMARAHGEKQKLSAASLGFNFSSSPNLAGMTGNATAPTRGGGSPQPAGAGATPANSASTHADRITFDFTNGRMQDVYTTPVARASSDGAGSQGNRKGGKGKGTQRGGADDEGPRPLAGGAASAADNKAELQKRLKTMLDTYLPSPGNKELMKSHAQDFVQGKTKATEYFQHLQKLFPDPDVLNAVFAPLVATLPDPTKREALTAAKTMLTSQEAVRHRKAQEEAAAARSLEETRAAERQKRLSSARSGASKAAAPKGAWASTSKSNTAWGNRGGGAPPAVAAGTAAPSPTAPSYASRAGGGGGGGGSASTNSNRPSGAGAALGVWGASAPPPPASGNTFLDPEAFPTLGPTSPTTQGRGSARAGASKPLPKSAWGSRR